MIFVTVGMHSQGFVRLVQAMDVVADEIGEPVVMQIGQTAYEPRSARWFRFARNDVIRKLSGEARRVVSHGAMSGLVALEQGVPAILVPRRKEFSEAVDDHQVDHALMLAKVIPDSVRVVLDVARIHSAVSDRTLQGPDPTALIARRAGLLARIEDFVCGANKQHE